MRILLTGASGQLGQVLQPMLARHGELLAPSSRELDLADRQALQSFVQQARPGLIVNAAAYTAVDKAESDVARAEAVNALAPMILAQQAQMLGAPLVHFSTDYVFDGKSARPYVETDPTGPLNVYGRTKLAGEQGIAAHCDAYWILRTSWVYGCYGSNFLKTMWRLAGEREYLTVVDDQIGAPTWTHTIADTLARMLAHGADAQQSVRDTTGLYHLSAGGATSWHGFAQRILQLLRAQGETALLDPALVRPIASDAYPAIAQRPRNSRLDTGLLRRTFSLSLPTWDEALERCLHAPSLRDGQGQASGTPTPGL
ncbi:dTDP-4-dehydrorhamnose reductase [Herbaspirillum seropedicae]|uniref:dTDP-4-dehydrorhamnose reductase n=1 Tax=Herbaspirillum seropedicae TaxID=964 RepID=UPI003D99CFD1